MLPGHHLAGLTRAAAARVPRHEGYRRALYRQIGGHGRRLKRRLGRSQHDASLGAALQGSVPNDPIARLERAAARRRRHHRCQCKDRMLLPACDGSGQLAHPDIAVLLDGFATHEFWLAATPYPNDNANLENPSLYTDTDHRGAVPPNIHNPLVPPAGLRRVAPRSAVRSLARRVLGVDRRVSRGQRVCLGRAAGWGTDHLDDLEPRSRAERVSMMEGTKRVRDQNGQGRLAIRIRTRARLTRARCTGNRSAAPGTEPHRLRDR